MLAELGLPLEELVRRGARDILQRAIEAEVEQLLEEFAGVSLMDGRRAVVRNGYLPAREILTTVGPVEVQVPKVRDRSGAGVKFNSALAPPYVRRSARVAAALPWLYLKGISSGDLGEALEVLVGEDAKGLAAAALGRLKAAWAEEYKDWTRRSLE
ncbi:transposase, partial [Thiocapsa sp.]|uniref:transposase n=1 Tax=Thiocapsa sp. TaxID=2024551 RepID=UPI0025F06379